MRKAIQLLGVGLFLLVGPLWAQETGVGAGVTELLVADEAEKIAYINLVAGETEVNEGLNFNGYARGEIAIVVPRGWRVDVALSNPSPMPHSAAIVPSGTLSISGAEDLAFSGASSPVLPTGSKESFRFVADQVGEYNLICPVAEHAPGGMWLRFVVSEEVSAPEIVSAPEL